VLGVVRIGESTLVAGYSNEYSFRFVHVNGPPLARVPQGGAACKRGHKPWAVAEHAALLPRIAESTRAGTLVALGRHCDKEMSAEIWDASGKSRIVPIPWKDFPFPVWLLKGGADDLYAGGDPFQLAFRVRGTSVEVIPDLARPMDQPFVSAAGHLHVVDGDTIYRFDGAWAPLAQIVGPKLATLAMDGDVLWGLDGEGALYRAKPGPDVPFDDTCRTPFVHLYKAYYNNASNYGYPTTKKALASFPEPLELLEVEYVHPQRGWGRDRHLVVKVKSRAQADAVIAHVKATMKDEDPRYFCFDPKTYRKL
jgi:hypothetical protein